VNYEDGQAIKVGDRVSIDSNYTGVVVANIEAGDYSKAHAKEQWDYLEVGVLIDTDFGGIVHYTKETFVSEEIRLQKRE